MASLDRIAAVVVAGIGAATAVAGRWPYHSGGVRLQSCTPRVSAPSTSTFVPVMKLAAGLLRNSTALATS